MAQVAQTAAQWVEGEVWEAGCAVIPFSSHSIYRDVKSDFVEPKYPYLHSNSFNSLGIHPGLWYLSHPFTPVETLSDFQPQTPIRARCPCQGHGSSADTGSFPLPMGVLAWGHWASGLFRTAQGTGDMGYLKSQDSSFCEQEGWNSPGTEPVPHSAWELSGDLRQQRSAAPEVYSSRKTNNFGKASAFGRLSLCRTEVAEKLSLGWGTNPSTPVNFCCLTHAHPFTEIQGARENLLTAHLCWRRSQAVKRVLPAPSCWKEVRAGLQEVSWWVARILEQESLKGRLFGSPLLQSYKG